MAEESRRKLGMVCGGGAGASESASFINPIYSRGLAHYWGPFIIVNRPPRPRDNKVLEFGEVDTRHR